MYNIIAFTKKVLCTQPNSCSASSPTSRNFLVRGWAQWKAMIEENWPCSTDSADLLASAVENTNIWLCCCMYCASMVAGCLLITLLGRGCTPSCGSDRPSGSTPSHPSAHNLTLVVLNWIGGYQVEIKHNKNTTVAYLNVHVLQWQIA